MQIFVDESGNLGKSGEYFVIACFIPQNYPRIKNIIKRKRVKFGNTNPLDEIKTSMLTFQQKQDILDKFTTNKDFSCSYIVTKKKHIKPNLLDDNNICYNYLASHLFKQIIVKNKNETIQVFMDNHTVKVKSLNSLEDYIRIEAITKWGFLGKISFSYHDSKSHPALQAADIVSNVVYGKYTYNKINGLYGKLEPFFEHRIKFPYDKFHL
jgi:hypothetical protein